MKQLFKTREEKIKLLNDLKAGRVSMNNMFPRFPENWIFEVKKGVYSKGDEELNEDEFANMKKRKGKNWLYTIYKLSEIQDLQIDTNCENFHWPENVTDEIDDKQFDKLLLYAGLYSMNRSNSDNKKTSEL